MTNYTQGGLADVAQHLAQKGRHGDTQLVHMSPKEVRGLQALATANGTSLTTNPTTGLPEAFRLEQLLPMAAGAALTATGVGAPLAALMVGGAYGAATGSIEKGLMAGIGAYGGAGLATGLANAGGAAAVESAGAEAVQQAATQSGSQLAAGTAEAGTEAALSAPQIQASNAINAQAFPNYSTDQISGLREAALRAENPMDVVRSAGMGNLAQSSQIVNPSMGQSFSNMGTGIGNLGTKQGLSAAYGSLPTGTLPATGITVLTAAQPQPSSVPGYQEDEYDRRLKGYRLSPNYQPYQAPTPNPYYRPTYAADGGMMSSFDDEPGEDMARGGVASLGGYSDGGRMLKGPGDGMSDSIPGVIGGRQPARLADGEFVVPADVVSHIGNGSTDAGAKKLYGMMDKIRQARTGKKKQAPQINAEKYLPMKKMASGGIVGYADGGITDSGVRSAVVDMLNSGVGGAEIGQALTAMGVSQEQAARATGLSADVIAQSYAGGATLSPISSAASLPTRPNVDASGSPIIPSFTDAQTAAFIRDNQLTTPAQQEQAFRMFNIQPDQQARALALLASNDPSVKAATDAYMAAIKANPNLAIQNALTMENRANDLGVKPIIPPKQTQTTPTKPTAPTNYPVYKQGFVPRVSGINMSEAVQDPYSNAGLEALYSQMMGQYARPTTQPMSDAQVLAFAQEFARANPGKGAELGQALINKGVPVNQTIAVSGLSPEIVNQAYLGGQYLGTTPPPTLNTLYNYRAPALDYRAPPVSNLILGTPISDAARPALAPVGGQVPMGEAIQAVSGDGGGG